MIKMTTALLSLTVVVGLSQDASAADAQKGQTLAKRWCATCHVVAADQTEGTTQAPAFSSIAKKAGPRCRRNRSFPARAASKNAGHEPGARRGGRSGGLYQEPREVALAQYSVDSRVSGIQSGFL